MSIRFDFSGRNVVVTGGAQGIGFQIVRDFLDAGARVALWDYSKEGIAHAQAELSQWKDQLQLEEVNVASLDSCQQAATKLAFSPHILVNNAGITRDKSFHKLAPEDFELVVRTNLIGTYNVTKTLLSAFDGTSKSNRIINLASVVALYGNFGQSNYVASKAGVIGLTKTLSRELARKGFTVNAIAPGFTLTPMVRAMPKEALDRMAEKIPVGRLGEPQDISKACLFLASEDAGYISGSVLSVDGGIVC